MRCPKCASENSPGSRFCNQCATSLAPRCPKCGAENALGARFCSQCATPLEATKTPQIPAATSSIRVASESSEAGAFEGERKTVTALFADIKGSMDLMEGLDPEEARTLVDPALKLMIDAVHRYDGYIVQSTGDGIFALFGAPVAHEDHPQRALYAALRMQEEMRRYSTRLREAGNPPLEARVGINTGEAVVRSIKTGDAHTEYTPIAHSTSLASRMQTLAPTGSIAVTETTEKLCAGYFNFKSLGPTRVKGVTPPINVFEVIGLGPLRTRLQRGAARGLTKFVGRDHEMDAMKHAAGRAASGHGQIVAAMADPGVGKSRLVFEFKAKNQSGWMVLEAFSVSHGKASAFLPVIDLLWNYFKLGSDDDERTRREKVAGKIAILDRSLEDALPYLFGLLGLGDEEHHQLAQIDPQMRKRRALDAIKRIILRESLNQPLMVIFEDLHWIDEESQGFLNLLADRIGTARILMLVNYRPEYHHEWSNKTYYTQLRLDPLGNESADEMLSALLGDGADLAPLKRMIIDQTDGNPLFMEETVQMLFEEGALARDGVVRLMRPLSRLSIPPTVQDILAARIDRLSVEHKDLLQTLAVIGTQFALTLVRNVVAKPEEELERMLSALQLSEFIYEQPASGETEYVFKHALTHDVAYKSVLNERRRMLHERIGAALESRYIANLDDHTAELAHHYARSSNAAKAVEYCLRACRQSANHGSWAETAALFETGLARLQDLPDDDRRAELELDLRNVSYLAWITIKGYGSREGLESAARALELSRRPGIAWEKSFEALTGLATTAVIRADVQTAHQRALQMLAVAEGHENPELTAESLLVLAFTEMFGGEFEAAAESLDHAISLYETLASPIPSLRLRRMNNHATTYSLWAWNACLLGFPHRALKRIDDALAIARNADSKAVEELVHNYAVNVFSFLDPDRKQVRASAENTVALASELGNPFRRAVGEFWVAWCDFVAHDRPEDIARMRRALADFRATGSLTMTPYWLALIAQSQCRLGQYDEALHGINEALALIEETGERTSEAEVHRINGECLLADSDATPAEESFRTAIDIARKQHTKFWELRATTSLARLLRDTNRRDEARTMLADIYGWFTEGFDTADLIDAKALLEELGP